MATLTPAEFLRMIGMRPELRNAMLPMMQAIENATGKKVTIPPRGGVRTNQQQIDLYNDRANNRSASGELLPVARPGQSKHEYGAAVDLNIVGGNDQDYARLADIIESTFGFTSGWPDDPVHVELPEPLATSQERWTLLQDERGGMIIALGAVAIVGAALLFGRPADE